MNYCMDTQDMPKDGLWLVGKHRSLKRPTVAEVFNMSLPAEVVFVSADLDPQPSNCQGGGSLTAGKESPDA